jgi:hypothetical protein
MNEKYMEQFILKGHTPRMERWGLHTSMGEEDEGVEDWHEGPICTICHFADCWNCDKEGKRIPICKEPS